MARRDSRGRFVKVGFDGFDQMHKALKGLIANTAVQVEAAAYRQAENVMADSKDNYVPVRDGALKSTGHVQLPERRGRQVEVTLAYGGPEAPYALVQHENPDLSHRAGKSWKYLEKPLMAAVPSMAREIAAELDKLKAAS